MKFAPVRKIFLTTLLLVTAASSWALEDREFKTSPVMKLETRTLVQMLEYFHYNKGAVKTSDYPQLISDYMKELDPQRLFFTASDEETFRRQYGPNVETDLAYLGNIDASFAIYKVYQQRVKSRATWIFDQLGSNWDFSAEETYTPDRTKSNFAASQEESDDLWRRRIKYEIIQDVLAKKTVDDAKTTVRKRYERMLKNISDIEPADVQETFLSSLTRMYDPHSAYFSADTLQDFSIQMKLSLVGIGAVLSIEEDGNCVVREVVPGGPAYRSGQIRVNDKIVAVQQEGGENIEVIGMKLRRIVDMIRGDKNSKVNLTILPHDATDGSKTKQVLITRDVIKLNAARASASIYQVPGENNETVPVGVIVLNSFYDAPGRPDSNDPNTASTDNATGTATQDVAELIGKLKAEGIKALVMDLRRNGGGLLPEAVNLTGLFIDKGPVVQVRDSLGRLQVDSDEDVAVAYEGPLVVLTSRFSASASEIFAGALQNYGRAVIIGDSSTHGKGTVQAVLEMKNYLPRLSQNIEHTGGAKLTIQKFYLPNGASTQKKGVVPDITLPSIEDFLPIGESDLPHALMWDEIKSTPFAGKPLDATYLQPLLEASRQRQKSLEEFAYLQKNIDWFKERQEQKSISLNLDQRTARKNADDEFKKQLDATRDALAKNNYAFKEVKLDSVLKGEVDGTQDTAKTELTEEGDEDSPIEGPTSKLDVHLREALRVVTDAIRLTNASPHLANKQVPPTPIKALNNG